MSRLIPSPNVHELVIKVDIIINRRTYIFINIYLFNIPEINFYFYISIGYCINGFTKQSEIAGNNPKT